MIVRTASECTAIMLRVLSQNDVEYAGIVQKSYLSA